MDQKLKDIMIGVGFCLFLFGVAAMGYTATLRNTGPKGCTDCGCRAPLLPVKVPHVTRCPRCGYGYMCGQAIGDVGQVGQVAK